jgi:hypothetical protein
VALRKLAFVLAALVGFARAQSPTYVEPQTQQQVLASQLPCTGSAQFFPILNLGQTQHYLTVSQMVNVQKFQAVLQSIDANGNVYPLTDVLEANPQGGVHGSGYYPKLQVQVICSPAAAGSFTANYSGAWGTFDINAGIYLSGQVDKVNFNNIAEGSGNSDILQTPFGSSAGTIYASYSVAGAGGSIAVSCGASEFNASAGPVVFSAPLANTTAIQAFQVPDNACVFADLVYTTNGQAGNFRAEYVYAQPGANRPTDQFTHVVGTTATVAKATAGNLHTVTVNTGGAGTLSLFDLASANCTGTPATNTIAVITVTATTLQTFTYDVNALNGICAKASVAMDYTVSSQ